MLKAALLAQEGEIDSQTRLEAVTSVTSLLTKVHAHHVLQDTIANINLHMHDCFHSHSQGHKICHFFCSQQLLFRIHEIVQVFLLDFVRLFTFVHAAYVNFPPYFSLSVYIIRTFLQSSDSSLARTRSSNSFVLIIFFPLSLSFFIQTFLRSSVSSIARTRSSNSIQRSPSSTTILQHVPREKDIAFLSGSHGK